MKKTILALFVFSNMLCAMQEVSDEVKEREHSVRDIIDAVAKGESKEFLVVSEAERMFKDAVVSGQLRALHSSYANQDMPNQYATALGGQLKLELAEFQGVRAAVEFTSSHDLGFATGEGERHNSELSSQEGRYTQLSQAYLHYKNGALNLRGGRVLLDTPLADSDDIRMVPNTFEAYMATYEQEGIEVIGAFLKEWQGVDTGLSSAHPWSQTGEDGTYVGGVSYAGAFVDTSLWYYAISKDEDPKSATGNVANSSFYTDISLHMALASDYALHTSAQYLQQKESDASGVESSIYGAMAEFVMFEDFALSAAYNRSQKQEGKGSFSGFGGGTLYTNMDSMILDAITMDREAYAFVAGATYRNDLFGFMYGYGDFRGDADSLGTKEHIVEQNVGVEYTPNKEITLAAIYVHNSDKKQTQSNGGNWENVRVLLTYNF